ncbi:MAG: hypothetical protein ACW99F_17405 [Candidatus Hodarchaeales archaeon]|jgi:hypothetical protein
MKVHSLTILHYGKDYLSYALRSVYHSVDVCHVFYTPTPSHGHNTNIPPIETKDELMQAAYAYDPENKIKWYDMLGLRHEGEQRDLALETVEAAGAELVVVVDCDEIWPVELVSKAIDQIKYHHARNYLINMIHFWRSFEWACYDQGWPVRLIDLRQDNHTAYIDENIGRIYHFGYATTDKVMNYKWQIHGHKNELRPNWFSTYWTAWPPVENCHPTNGRNEQGEPFWTPELFDKKQLPEFMRQHPFYDLEKIE